MKLTNKIIHNFIKKEISEATAQTKASMDVANNLCRTQPSLDSSNCDDFFAPSQADHWVDLEGDREEINKIALGLRKQYSNNWANMVIDLMDILVKLRCVLAGPHVDETTQKEIKTIVSVIKKILKVQGEIQCQELPPEREDSETPEEKIQRYRDAGFGRRPYWGNDSE